MNKQPIGFKEALDNIKIDPTKELPFLKWYNGMYNEQENKMSLGSKIFLLVVSLILLASAVFLFDSMTGNSWAVSLKAAPDCNYVVPVGYKVVYNDIEKKYAVKIINEADKYLYEGRYGTTDMYSSIAQPQKFKDSCGAKGYVKMYIEDKQPKANNFK